MKVGRKPGSRPGGDAPIRPEAPVSKRAAAKRRAQDGPGRSRAGTRTRPQEAPGPRSGPQTAPAARPSQRPARPKSTTQAKARAKARKAKAPKVVRPSLQERLLAKLATVDLNPRTLLAKIPFVVLIIAALAIGLGITLWLSTDAARRSYQLGNARALNAALTQQKEALERDVLVAESAPALADAARNLGMIPSRDAAHLVLDPAGNWVVVGQPKPAEGGPPPPLNTKLPEEKPPAPAPPPPPAKPALPPVPAKPAAEVPVRTSPGAPGREVPVLIPVPHDSPATHIPAGTQPAAPPLPGPAPAPAPPAAPALPPAAAPVAPVAVAPSALPAVPGAAQ